MCAVMEAKEPWTHDISKVIGMMMLTADMDRGGDKNNLLLM
jgi:hypothetical protein